MNRRALETPLETGEPALRPAAVLVPVYRDAGRRLRLVLVRRASGGVHGGQLALPGGKVEPEDRTLLDAALREAHEEIGLDPGRVTVLATLPPVDTRVSGFLITPFLARAEPPLAWRTSEQEIAEVLDVAVEDLLRPGVHDTSLEQLAGRPEQVAISYYHVSGYRLWGATYRIVHPLLPRLVAGEWEV